VQGVSFTGSTAVGRLIATQAGAQLKRTVLELGGHAPVLIDRGVDLDYVIATTLPAKMGSGGQSRVAPSRYLVHESKIDDFAERMVSALNRLVVGHYTEFGVRVGPVIHEGRVRALERLTGDAIERGARRAVAANASIGRATSSPRRY
jgi:succinate-semialdehyde dehydrogenase/glutarate-semialdehyde dehydrogenase